MEGTTLQLRLMADISDLVSKMDAAKEKVNGSMATMADAFSFAKGALIGLVGIGSVGAFAGMIKGSIDATGALKDMSAQTGASEAALGQFRSMGAYTETSMDSIGGAMNKLSKNMVGSTEDSKGAAVAIKALGLDFDTFKRMAPEEQMLAVGKSMNQFADGADKGAAAQALFGKEGAKLLPFLKDLGDGADQITTKLTEQEIALKKAQAAMADAFGDNLTAISKNSEAWKKDLANGMTPALYEASQAFLDVSKGTGGLSEEMSKLSKDGTITEWTRGAITGLTYLMDVFSGLKAVVKSVGEYIGYAMASVAERFTSTFTAIDQAVHGNFSGAMDTMQASVRQQKVMADEFAVSLDETWGEQTLGSKLRARMEDIKTVGIVAESTKPQLDQSGALAKTEAAHKASAEAQKASEAAAKALTAENKKQQDQYEKLVSGIGEKTAAMELEMAQGTKLTESQKLENKLYQDMASGVVILTDKQLDNTLAQINNMRATEEKYEAYKRDQAQTAENTKENAAYIDKLQKGTEATNAQIDKQRECNDTLLLSREELALLSIQKDLDTAATLERTSATIKSTQGETAQTNAFDAQAEALRTLAGLKEQGIHVKAAKEAQDAWAKTTESIGKGLSSALTDAVMNGKDIWRTFRDYMVKTIIDGAIKNAFASVITDGLNAMTSSILGIGGPTAGGVAGGVAGASGGAVGSVAGSSATSSISSAVSGAIGLTAANGGGAGVTGIGMGSTMGALDTAASLAETVAPWAVGYFAVDAILGHQLSQGVGHLWGALTGGGHYVASVGDTGAHYKADGSLASTDPLSSYAWAASHTALSDGVVGNLNAAYMAATRQLGITPIDHNFQFDANDSDGGKFALGGSAGSGNYYQPETGMSQDAVANASTAALVAALRGSTSSAAQLAAISAAYPGFAGGGDFGGGYRIVGENGPELEATGPSRIFNADQTASMLRSGGAGGQDLIDEMRLLREEVRGLRSEAQATAGHTAKTARLLDRAMPDGDALATRVTA